jgi:hypothetical protein
MWILRTSISEEESRVVYRNYRARFPIDVILLFEELDEGIAYSIRWPVYVRLRRIDASRHGGEEASERSERGEIRLF